jgi:hypothetical protein
MNATTITAVTPAVPAGGVDVVVAVGGRVVTVGNGFTFNQIVLGTVRAWGNNDYGQCNIPADLGPCTAIAGGALEV